MGVPLPSAHCVRSHLPQGDGFLAVAVQFPTEAESCLPGSQPSPSSLRDATSPERGRFCSTYRQKPCLRGFNPRKKAAAPGAVQRLISIYRTLSVFLCSVERPPRLEVALGAHADILHIVFKIDGYLLALKDESSFTLRQLQMALRPQVQMVSISSMVCASSSRRVEPGKPLREKSARRP